MTKVNPREGKTWPAYILGGRLRTSTLLLFIAFIGIGWVYHNYDFPPRGPQQVPASEVVPPGFVPDPAYTWAPRTDFQRPAAATTTPTTTEPATPTTTPGEEPHGPIPSGEPTTPAVPPSSPVTTPVPSGPPPGPPGPPASPPPPAPPPGV